jgi:hypothetical protein
MKLICCAASLAFASMLATAAPQKAGAQSQVEISYEEPTNPELRPIYEQLMAQGALTQLQRVRLSQQSATIPLRR